MTTSYCVRADVASIIGEAAVLSAIDDDQDGVESVTETTYVTDAIERAAVEINSSLGKQYILSELSANDWCKWCNAYLAADMLFERKGNPPPPAVITRVQGYRDNLAEAAWGRWQLPEQVPSREHRPTVSNFKVEMGRLNTPIRVSQEESSGVGPTAGGGILRETSNQPGWW